MDKNLKGVFNEGAYFEVYEHWYLEGYKKAIERIRTNKFYGYQGEFLATWLEKHLTQEVTSFKATDK